MRPCFECDPYLGKGDMLLEISIRGNDELVNDELGRLKWLL